MYDWIANYIPGQVATLATFFLIAVCAIIAVTVAYEVAWLAVFTLTTMTFRARRVAEAVWAYDGANSGLTGWQLAWVRILLARPAIQEAAIRQPKPAVDVGGPRVESNDKVE